MQRERELEITYRGDPVSYTHVALIGDATIKANTFRQAENTPTHQVIFV